MNSLLVQREGFMQIRFARFLLTLIVLVAGVAFSGTVDASRPKPRPDYGVRNLPSLGGTVSGGQSINNRGLVAGYSYESGGETAHATLWRDGEIEDLGTLGGPNSAVLWPVKNNRGLIVGVTETDETDPYDENWSCSVFFPGEPTDNVCRGFVWEDGEMTALPTLGGTHGFAAGANNRGQVVGWAENTVEDDTCNDPQIFQFHAVVWEKQRGEWRARELLPFGDDTVSSATAINDRGQVVGISGICANAVGGFSAIRAVLWEPDGTVVEIGTLGGVAWNTAMAINDRGTVVGFSNKSADDGDSFNEQAFIWTKRDGIQPIDLLPGDTRSQALGINNRGQVVGQSCGGGVCRAFLWEDGVTMDLNMMVDPNYPDHLDYANDINDKGEITGGASVAGSDDSVAYLATPRRGHGSR